MKLSDAMARLRGELRYEPTEKRIRAELGGQLVVDTTRALLVWEPNRIVPTFAVRKEDLWARLGPGERTEPDASEFLHPGIPFAVHSTEGEAFDVSTGGETREGAAFRVADPDLKGCPELEGYVLLDFHAFDRWYEEDEPLRSHPRDPYHRVDVRLSSRHVVIARNGQTLADTTRPTLVFETTLPVRFYVPREDVVAPLTDSDTTTYCPYKGEASYFSVEGRNDLAWSYRNPLPDATQLTGLIAFYDDVLDVTVDGVLRERSDTAVAKALRKEFGVVTE